MSDIKTATATTEEIVRRAIADPGAGVPRGDNYAEPLTAWQARAVLAALEAKGLTIVDRATAENARAAERVRCVAELRAYSTDRMSAAVAEVVAGKDEGFASVAHAAAVQRAAELLESGERSGVLNGTAP